MFIERGGDSRFGYTVEYFWVYSSGASSREKSTVQGLLWTIAFVSMSANFTDAEEIPWRNRLSSMCCSRGLRLSAKFERNEFSVAPQQIGCVNDAIRSPKM